MSGRRLTVYDDPADEGPLATHDGLLSIGVGQLGRTGEWRVIVALEARGSIAAGETVTADLDPADVDKIMQALDAARADLVRRRSDA